jgi:hypothetical protein
MSTSATAIMNAKFVSDLEKLQATGILRKTDTISDFWYKCTMRGYNDYLKDLAQEEDSL